MNQILRFGGWGAGTVAVILAIVYNPVFAGYVFVGIAFTVMAVLMALSAGRSFSDWRLDHPWKLRRHHKRA